MTPRTNNLGELEFEPRTPCLPIQTSFTFSSPLTILVIQPDLTSVLGQIISTVISTLHCFAPMTSCATSQQRVYLLLWIFCPALVLWAALILPEVALHKDQRPKTYPLLVCHSQPPAVSQADIVNYEFILNTAFTGSLSI